MYLIFGSEGLFGSRFISRKSLQPAAPMISAASKKILIFFIILNFRIYLKCQLQVETNPLHRRSNRIFHTLNIGVTVSVYIRIKVGVFRNIRGIIPQVPSCNTELPTERRSLSIFRGIHIRLKLPSGERLLHHIHYNNRLN